MTREDLMSRVPSQLFDMKGDLLIIRTITHDFDGYLINPDLMYECRWYEDVQKWLIEPKNSTRRLKVIPKIIGFKKKS